ncbi:hypothetical protein V6Z11_1Z002300 [Gossypium hirsutum]
MKSLNRSLSMLFIVVCSLLWVSASANSHDDFLECLYSYHPKESSSITQVIYTETNSSYSAVLDSSIRNHRFSTPNTPKPLVIVTPLNISHHGLQIRTRSGGHDYEGLSYVSHVPFVVIDLVNLRSVDVDVENEEAWVQSGATVGEVYYRINERSTNLTFPAAVGRTVGIGGSISGGGDGLLFRKYGLSADNVIDALLVDANGRVLDRRSMGEDLFGPFEWAGPWNKMQHSFFIVGNTLHPIFRMMSTQSLRYQRRTPVKMGQRRFLPPLFHFSEGGANEFIPLMQERFPELGLVKEDFIEMTWIESLLLMNGASNETSEILLDRSNRYSLLPPSFKSKSDYVREPMPEIALQGLWLHLLEIDEGGIAVQNFFAYGGIMEEISETETPFPHRKGTLFKISYNIAYVNYRDLDIGRNNYYGKTSYKQASIWGHETDPKNFFKHEQSIPPRFH